MSDSTDRPFGHETLKLRAVFTAMLGASLGTKNPVVSNADPGSNNAPTGVADAVRSSRTMAAAAGDADPLDRCGRSGQSDLYAYVHNDPLIRIIPDPGRCAG